MGCVYIVKAKEFNRVKVGYWTSSMQKLRMRYVTCYGNDLSIDTYTTKCPMILEKVFKHNFKEFCVCCELFTLSGYEIYKQFLTSHCNFNSSEELMDIFKEAFQDISNKEQIQQILDKHKLEYIIDDDLMEEDRKEANYETIRHTQSDVFQRVLSCIKEINQNGLTRTIRRVEAELLGLFIIRKFIEEANCIDEFQKYKRITVLIIDKEKYMTTVKDAIGVQDFIKCIRFYSTSKLKATDTVIKRINSYITILMSEFLQKKSFRRVGPKKSAEYRKRLCNVFEFK